METLAVVLPAHNEASAIGQVLREIPKTIDQYAVVPIVVDDGSRDATSEIARRHGAVVVRHNTNLGVGAATRTGFDVARRMDVRYVATLDADGQHDAADLARLFTHLVDGQHDVVIGSRMLDPWGMPVTRFGANLLLNALTYVVYGKIVSDSQSGYKLLTREAVDRLELHSIGYEICSEIIGEIYRKNLSYKSVPVRAIYTKYSKAKGQHFLNGVNLVLGLFMRWMRRV